MTVVTVTVVTVTVVTVVKFVKVVIVTIATVALVRFFSLSQFEFLSFVHLKTLTTDHSQGSFSQFLRCFWMASLSVRHLARVLLPMLARESGG